MTDARGTKGGRGLSAFLPGLPQLLAGRWGGGVAALMVWVGGLWILMTRSGRVARGMPMSLSRRSRSD
jgi:hypothetical protein